jgi:tetratricopeptide (TPR) repeat protein/CHAT domain-containing protein
VGAAQPVPLPEDEPRQELERRATAVNKEALLLMRVGLIGPAIKKLEQALVLYQRLYPRDSYPKGHLDLARVLSNLGVCLHLLGEDQKALPHCEQALNIHEALYPKKQYPQGHPSLANSLTSVGSLLQAVGEAPRALPYLRRALAMAETLYPEDRYPRGHILLASVLNNLGLTYQDLEDFEKARPLHERALAMTRRLFPKEQFPEGYPEIATSLTHLAATWENQGIYARALPLRKQALAMWERLAPPEKYPQGNPQLAICLNNLGLLLDKQGEFRQALASTKRALAMYESLYPAAKYPHGHPKLATTLNNLGLVYKNQGDSQKALPYFERALVMREVHFPKARYPTGHAQLAASLINLASLLQDLGEYQRALPLLERALAMNQALYPRERYPSGHPELANTFSSLASLLVAQGEHQRARPYAQQALAMNERLCPKEQFPRGHVRLATALSNLASLLWHEGETAKALPYLERAVSMYETLFPKDQYPEGHSRLANSLNSLAVVHLDMREFDQARTCGERALAMYKALFPPERFPRGHPDLAATLGNLGNLCQDQGQFAKAQNYFERAVATAEALYPVAHYPQGHPHLAATVTNLAGIHRERGDYKTALGHFRRALVMYQDLADAFAAAVSEAEALNLAASLPRVRDGALSVSRHLKVPAKDIYPLVWRSRAALTRLVQQRQQALRAPADLGRQPEALQDYRALLAIRRELGSLLLAPAGDDTDRGRRLEELTRRKEELERSLARRLPGLAQRLRLDPSSPVDLADRLPAGTVFVDFVHYMRIEHDPKIPGRKGQLYTPSYVAFVLSSGRPPARVELGRAQTIEAALADWHKDITGGREGTGAADLCRLVWKPVAAALPAGSRTIFLAPDGALTWIPWAALQGKKPGTVLLEDHALAVVPHGPFLLEALRRDISGERHSAADGTLLAVGGVNYDRRAGGAVVPDSRSLKDFRSLAGGDGPARALPGLRLNWPQLPGTLREVERVTELAGKRKVRRRSGTEASATQLLADLVDARLPPRWAHLATHGFFADQQFRSVLQLDEKLFRHNRLGERAGVGARSPLVLSGLVLAGANLRGKEAPRDGGILTAEAIAGMDLDQLELAVLSACETGLGEVAGGEGVFGLQRAFHLAGARNVIASLWKVDDDSTAALMSLFYYNLWVEQKAPIESLRQAQLTLYQHPERIPALARQRGPDFEKTARLPPASRVASSPRAPARLWAGFVLSGAGR